MKKTYFFAFFYLLCFSINIYSAGTNSADFLKIGVGAKNIAIGETGATELGVNSIYWNPAGLNGVESKEIAFMHGIMIGDVTFENISYAQKFDFGILGISANYLNVKEIPKYDNTGFSQVGSFKPYDVSLCISYANKISLFPVGITLKYIQSSLDDVTASAVAFDYGIIYYTPIDGLDAGLSIQNVGTPMKFDEEAFSLPTNIKLGCSYFILNQSVLYLDVNKSVDDYIFNFGGEYWVKLSQFFFASLRAGYKSNMKHLNSNYTGFSSGVGLEIKNMTIDYAFLPFGDLDNIHRISLSFLF